MKIQNINCQYIKVLSSSYEKNYLADNLKSVEIEVTDSDSTVTTEAITISDLYDEWTLAFTFDSNTVINQFYLKNAFTGQTYPLLADGSEYDVDVTDMDAVAVLISTALSNLGIAGTYAYEIDGTTVTFTFQGLPAHIIGHSVIMTLTAAAISTTKYFSYTDSSKYILNGDDIFLLPAFFGLESFVNNVYEFKVSVIDKDDILTTEEVCFFMDCTLSQSLIDNIDVDDCNEFDVNTTMLHYALRVASNGECNCDKMQSIFTYLNKRIGSSNTNPCGC